MDWSEPSALWDILHTVHNQGDVCELVKLSLFVQLVQHDFVVRRELAAKLHLPLPLDRHDPHLPSLQRAQGDDPNKLYVSEILKIIYTQ